MARIRKQMTQTQFERSMKVVELKLGRITPLMRKQAKRYQATMRRNVRTSMNANKTKMAPLSPLTLRGNISTKSGGQGPKRSSYGNKPLEATGEMVRALKAFADSKGWVAYVTDEFKRMVSFWQANVPTGENLNIKSKKDRSGRSMARAMAKKGMPVSPAKAAHGFNRPARLPFAMSSRQVKRSVTELNKFVLSPFLK